MLDQTLLYPQAHEEPQSNCVPSCPGHKLHLIEKERTQPHPRLDQTHEGLGVTTGKIVGNYH